MDRFLVHLLSLHMVPTGNPNHVLAYQESMCASATEGLVFSVAFLLALLSAAAGNYFGSERGFQVAFKGHCCVCSKFLPICSFHNLNTSFLMHLSQAILRKGALD